MNHDRRSFLVAVAALARPSQAAEGDEIRTAHIGVGVRGGSLLRQSLAQANVRIAAICDIDGTTRDQGLSAASRDSPKSITEWRRVLDLKDVDAVFIGTPCDLHAEMAAACLEAGKHVYCEKPLGITPEQVDRVVKAARRAKGIFQIGQQLRYYPTMREAIARIHAPDLLGRSYIIKAQRHSSRGRSPADTQQTTQQKTRADWYADVRRSGDLLVENSVHNIDACNWIANSRPVSAYGHGKKYFPQPIPAGTQMMDGYSVEYIYENDMHLDYSQIAFHPRQLKQLPNGMWYVIYGEKGSVYLTHDSAEFYDLHGENAPMDILSDSKRLMEERKQRGIKEPDTAIEDFFACIREKRKPFADITVAATAALTAIMGREAIYKRRMVTWKELGVTL
jgi:predicted dehydrogenase